MGYYINKLPNGTTLPVKGKADFLIKYANAVAIDKPTYFKSNLVCVVDNGIFEAAGYAYDQKEMLEFLSTNGRPSQWLDVPDADLLSNFKKW